ncbi:esterase family protein [Vibrio sp. S4M6]|uniref:alpha/beta hydrolase n=1 Tax=Vibrio sinus TaxID=2946865 RepID=UPI00202A92F8|nr:alpha/beta hydrolase-fold protein [Vibrio sinus]MCL9780693.1 esterase family protein [Vibrio sinus]
MLEVPSDIQKMIDQIPDLKAKFEKASDEEKALMISKMTDVPKQVWVNPHNHVLENLKHGQYESQLMQTDIGFSLYLPPDYEHNGNKRYPVVYFLHGQGCNESSHLDVAEHYDSYLKNGLVDPAILVFVNGGIGTMFTDFYDNSLPVESSFLNELIPYIDEHYRTISDRGGRKLFGFSMGGFGAMKIAFKYPDRFSSVLTYGAALHSLDSFKKSWFRNYQFVFGEKEDYFNLNCPSVVASEYSKNPIRQYPLQIKLVVGDNDLTYEYHRDLVAILIDNKAPFEYVSVEGPSHHLDDYFSVRHHADLQGLVS